MATLLNKLSVYKHLVYCAITGNNSYISLISEIGVGIFHIKRTRKWGICICMWWKKGSPKLKCRNNMAIHVVLTS